MDEYKTVADLIKEAIYQFVAKRKTQKASSEIQYSKFFGSGLY